ncbi:MAG TPA: VapC toxin family PIN domain ribonuclease, partial [Spirochaetaceae bacterium]|nr:VapC toxin family PIN domain ribonuclease [Spirochaetaceae bacterium]
MRLLIDTCAYSALLAGDQRVAEELGTADVVLLSPIVIGELYDGFMGSRRESANRSLLTAFRQKP